MLHEFEKEIKRIEDRITVVKDLNSVNDRLMKYNWVFLHPYSQGMDIGILNRLLDEKESAEKILDFFGRKFLNLRATIHFIYGFYKVRPFLKDFATPIEESVLLCIQKDFRGAISVLIPVIEGTLRNFLVQQQGDEWKNKTGKGILKESIKSMVDAYVELCTTYLRKRYKHLLDNDRYFSSEEELQILFKEREYFQLWVGQLERYLDQNLYHDTRKGKPTDLFNRHLIFHALNDTVDFSFSNYLRLYNCIHFISWAIGSTTYESSPLSEANEREVFEKYKAYLKVLIFSEALTSTKQDVLGKSLESFKRYLSPEYTFIVERPKVEILKTLAVIDALEYNPEVLVHRHRPRILLKKSLSKWLTGFLFRR